MWTPEHRRAADRRGLRYPSDMADAEWALVEPLIPPAKRGGRRRTVNVREVLNAIFYVLWTGCQWTALPKDLPPKSTFYDYLDLWEWDGTLERLHHTLYVAAREEAGREASPTAAIIDSQSVAPQPTLHESKLFGTALSQRSHLYACSPELVTTLHHNTQHTTIDIRPFYVNLHTDQCIGGGLRCFCLISHVTTSG